MKSISAAFLIIGDEILSGRTNDQNLNFLATELTNIGIELKEVRVVRDDEDDIIFAVNNLKNKYDYLFTSGGIGPTHDDITSKSIAKACGDIYEKNQQAADILIKYYGEKNINNAKLKMAFLPKKATLLDNPISSAPGFCIENIFVMAGVPKIFQAMFFAAKKELQTTNKIESKEVIISLTESVIANDLGLLQEKYSDISIGSYPFEGGTAIVFRAKNDKLLEMAVDDILKIINNISSKAILEVK